MSKIYYAGYLLKRSNHPVAGRVNHSDHSHNNESSERRHVDEEVANIDHSNMQQAYTQDNGDDHHDMFEADWDEDSENLLGPSLPVLPLTATTTTQYPSLNVRTTIGDYDDENDTTPLGTTNQLSSFLPQHKTPAVLPRYRDVSVSGSVQKYITAPPPKPETFIMSSKTNKQYRLQREISHRATPHLLSPQNSFQNDEAEDKPIRENQQRRERFLKLASDFFGILSSSSSCPPSIKTKRSEAALSPSTTTTYFVKNGSVATQLSSQESMTTLHHRHRETSNSPRKHRSSPIKMPDTGRPLGESFHENNADGKSGSSHYQRAQSEVLESHHQEQPLDFHDEKGHIWRSKFCILEDGVLYFYRNQADGESPQAKAERITSSTHKAMGRTSPPNTTAPSAPTIDSLARSPVPRKIIANLHNSHTYEDEPVHLWEKRVEVQSIGAVRSAEAEYGQHCFALLSPPSDIDGDGKEADSHEIVYSIESAVDKLILQARNTHEMAEWLFQFHRSIAIFVEDLIRTARSPFELPANFRAPMPSPRHITLSHGHGRALSLRRRQNDCRGETSLARSITTSQSVITPPRRIKQLSDDGLNWLPMDKSIPHRLTSSSTDATVSVSSQSTTPTFLSPLNPSQLILPVKPSSKHETSPSLTATTKEEDAASLEDAEKSSATDKPAYSERNDSLTPELAAPPSIYPETERPMPFLKPRSSGGKYIPPHKRRQQQQQQTKQEDSGVKQPKASRAYVPPHLRKNGKVVAKAAPPPRSEPSPGANPRPMNQSAAGNTKPVGGSTTQPSLLNLGGCADPRVVTGSIMDSMFIPRKASKLKREVRTDPFGYRHKASAKMTWDIGAVSECGIRDSNEDSYLVAGDLIEVLGKGKQSLLNNYTEYHSPGLFCVFDGHLGDQAARYSAERLTSYLEEESLRGIPGEDAPSVASFVENVMRRALEKLDDDFCKLCVKEGREWESGTTALLAALVDNHLVVGNLGDARAVACRSVETVTESNSLEQEGWSRLPESDAGSTTRNCLWIEMSETHSPSREDEQRRIDLANGWITYEKQIPIAQLHRLNLQDKDVFDILQRCFADRYESSPRAAAPQRVLEISRVCGELAVSRALGDRDFKAAFNNSSSSTNNNVVTSWDSPLFLSFPEDHSRCFQGDLISNIPEFRTLKVGEGASSQVSEEFFLFACDGLWDVMDLDDAVRVTRDLLFVKKWPAREAAARLAELAVHLGSSDNITVIVLLLSDTPPPVGTPS